MDVCSTVRRTGANFDRARGRAGVTGPNGDDGVSGISNPIINSPYLPPECHFEIGPHGPTGTLVRGRRPSESYIPIPVSRKGGQPVQQTLDFDITGERREANSLVNDIRRGGALAGEQLERRDAVLAQASCPLERRTADEG
jgi:hypothetical protein